MKVAGRILAAAALLGVVGQAVYCQNQWPIERYDRWGTGKQPIGPATYIQPWKGYRIQFSGCIVSCGPVIDAEGHGYFSTWQQNRVFKFDVASGALLGSFNALNFVASMAAIGSGDNIYCVTSSGASSRIFELNRQTMDFNWFQPTTSPGQGDYYHSAPLVGPDGRVYVGNESGQFRCLINGVGTVLWTAPLTGPIFRTAAFVRDDSQIIVTAGSTINGLKPINGKVNWALNLGSTLGAPGVSPSNVVVFGNDAGTIYGINPNTGTIIWTRPTLARVFAAPAFDIVNGTEVAYVASEDQSLYCIRVSDGVRLWTFASSSPFRNPPVVDNLGYVYAKTAGGTLYKVSPQGAGVWQLQFNGSSRGPMTIGNDGTLYIGLDGSDSLYAIRQTRSVQTADNYTVDLGKALNGSLAETFSSDNQYLSFGTTPRTDQIRATFVTISPANGLHKLHGRLELSSPQSTSILKVKLLNVINGQWETVTKGLLSNTDSVINFTVPNNATRFVSSSTREVKLQLELSPRSGEMPGRPLTLYVDEVHMELEPVFQL